MIHFCELVFTSYQCYLLLPNVNWHWQCQLEIILLNSTEIFKGGSWSSFSRLSTWYGRSITIHNLWIYLLFVPVGLKKKSWSCSYHGIRLAWRSCIHSFTQVTCCKSSRIYGLYFFHILTALVKSKNDTKTSTTKLWHIAKLDAHWQQISNYCQIFAKFSLKFDVFYFM